MQNRRADRTRRAPKPSSAAVEIGAAGARSAALLQSRALAQGAGYRREGPLSERMHLVAIGGRFVHGYADMLRRYAS